MSPQLRNALRTINQRFYDRFATEFDSSRQRAWPGWERLLQPLDDPPSTVLDAGCGNGRFGTFLANRGSRRFRYVGIDSCSALLTAAKGRLDGVVDTVELRQDDLLADSFEPAVSGERFDLVTLFAVLHHVPGTAHRQELLRKLSQMLSPGGKLAASIWRFDRNPRFDRKRVSWETYNRQRVDLGQAPLDLTELELGDTLLSWGGDTTHPRYCHFPEDSEIEAWTNLFGCRQVDRFEADGATGRDNLYLVWRC